MKIDEALEEFDFFNEGDYITREMSIAKDVVLQELENTKADLYEANNRIVDLLLVLGDRDRMIDAMIEEYEYNARINLKSFCEDETRKDKCIQDCRICVKKYFEKRCKDAKD